MRLDSHAEYPSSSLPWIGENLEVLTSRRLGGFLIVRSGKEATMQTTVTTRGTGTKITIRSTRPGTVRLVGRTQVVAVGTTPKAPHVIKVKPAAA